MIKFEKVNFKYDEKPILENFNLKIEDGERVCFFAESGFGKTTILRLIMGLEKAQIGSIKGLKDKKISVVFQEDRLIKNKTLLQNVELFGDKENAERLLEVLNLSDAKNLYPHELSGGMARRAAIARALNHKADIYIFDEPFNGIDKENIEKTAQLILEITKNKTVIAVTHSVFEAELLNSRIINL